MCFSFQFSKRSIWFILLLLVSVQKLSSSEWTVKESYFENRGHNSIIRDMVHDQKNDRLITASDDGTIRFWDIHNRQAEEILYQEDNHISAINKLLLSSDGKTLIAAGYAGTIYIYDLEVMKRKLVITNALTGTVFDMAFLNAPNEILTAHGDGQIYLYTFNEDFTKFKRKLFKRLRCRGQVRAIYLYEQYNYKYLLAGTDTNFIYRIDLKSNKTISDKVDMVVSDIKSFDNKIVFCGIDKRDILIYDFRFKLIKRLEAHSIPVSMTVTNDGKYLITGAMKSPLRCSVFDLETYKIHRKIRVKNTVIALNSYGEESVFLAGESDFSLKLYNFNRYKEIFCMKGLGLDLFEIQMSNNRLYFNLKKTRATKDIEFQEYIDFSDMSLKKSYQNVEKEKYSHKKNNYELSHEIGYDEMSLVLSHPAIEDQVISYESSTGINFRNFSFINENVFVSSNNAGELLFYDVRTRLFAKIDNQGAIIWDYSIDKDKVAVSYSDKTVKIFDISSIQEVDLESNFNRYEKRTFPLLLTVYTESKNKIIVVADNDSYYMSEGCKTDYGRLVVSTKNQVVNFRKSLKRLSANDFALGIAHFFW